MALVRGYRLSFMGLVFAFGTPLFRNARTPGLHLACLEQAFVRFD
jgi:hypothetical protein